MPPRPRESTELFSRRALYTGVRYRGMLAHGRRSVMDLTTPLTYIKGVWPARAAMLEAKGLLTVEDLIGYFPFRYEDPSNMKTSAQLATGEMATVIDGVISAKRSGFQRRNLGMFEARFTDSSGAVL